MEKFGPNPIRLVLVTIGLAAVGAAKMSGSVPVAMIFYAIAALAAAGILWLLFADTLLPRGVEAHEDAVIEHPEREYEHGWVLNLVSHSGPIEDPLRIWCDAPIYDASVKGGKREGGRADALWWRPRNYCLRVTGGIPRNGLYVQVYSKQPIRTVAVRRHPLKGAS